MVGLGFWLVGRKVKCTAAAAKTRGSADALRDAKTRALVSLGGSRCWLDGCYVASLSNRRCSRRGTWDDVGSAAMYSSAVGPVVLSAALNGWRRWWRRAVDRCMGNETPAFTATYRGATLDVMVAFCDRSIVFRYQEKRNCFQLVYSTISHS